ncbi:MAG: hypothetical protein ABIF09_18720 [Gemmatimonadota bacterium]
MIPQPHPADGTFEAALRFVALLRDLGATHVVTVPDNTSAPILSALKGAAVAPAGAPGREGAVRVLYATREGEAMGLASGLWLGGALPVILIQNTGLLEAGDGLRGTASRMGAPILLLITCRGYATAREAGVDPSEGEVDRDVLVRNDLDSVAYMTEATLRAWGIPFSYLRDSSDLAPIEMAFAQAQKDQRPVAVLIDTSFDGLDS